MSGGTCSKEANPLGAAHYADQAAQTTARVIENVQLASGTYRIRLEAPEIAARVTPGQFLMLRLAGGSDPLLGRPLALYDTWLGPDGTPQGVDVVYLVVGRMTGRLAQVKAGDAIETWGPLGNGFSNEPVDHLIMVAGGIGQTPFLALGREALGGRHYGDPSRQPLRAGRATLCYGVRAADLLAGVDDFRGAGIDVRVSSDDGSVGRQGLVTATLGELLDDAAAKGETSIRIACCGPERMMEAVAHLAIERGVACELSLETPMACGIGICFSCVVKVRQPDGEWDYKRTCVEGPIFAAEKIEW
ncbi:dihydroorotate dehydrogenase electron transfer subunit [Lacipirellula sp.]|uniref:dihydroorotate dehydrogenase electron transfer subunit n=1 Tax=Lacipirellula sp. TaxID=2691419 RepID=UPI003D0B0BC0